MLHRIPRLLIALAFAAALDLPAAAQTAPSQIDASDSYASLWMGRDTEVTVIVNVGVAQVGGAVTLSAQTPAASSLEFTLVPGGDGAALLAPDGTLRADVVAPIMRYTAMTFRSARARVRRDGLLEFTGVLAVTHVTREVISEPWNWGYSGVSYDNPVTQTATRNVTFALATPRAEFLASYLQKHSELVLSATIDEDAFPQLPGIVLDSYWPIVREDEQCAPTSPFSAPRDYEGWTCKGKAITTTPAYQPAQTTGRDYSGLRRYDAPTHGPVTILLHLKLATPVAATPAPPGP